MNYESKLLKAYSDIFSNNSTQPAWATHKNTLNQQTELIHPSIPFVGKDYHKQKTKILLYASAENLSNYHTDSDKNNNYLDDDKFAINRHRNFFNNSTTFFPNVHIQPINDGLLPIVALYVYSKYQNIDSISPKEFLERIAFANYCKFTIDPETTDGKNVDYAQCLEYLSLSNKYIQTDLSVLNPDIIIMPKTIYNTNYDFINKYKGNAKIVPIWQINAQTINRLIGKKYDSLPLPDSFPEPFQTWYDKLSSNGITGKTKKNFKHIFHHIDEALTHK